MALCKCGCGRETKIVCGKPNRFIHGHSGNFYKNGHEFQGDIARSNYFKKGYTPWNKDKKGVFSVEARKKQSEAAKNQKNRNIEGLKLGWGYWRDKHNPHMVGEKNPNYKGGISKIKKNSRRLDMETLEYKQWRRAVFKRDYWTCLSCGESKGGNFIAHHIKKYDDYPSLKYNVDNGFTLCGKCHLFTYGYEEDYEKYFLEILKWQ